MNPTEYFGKLADLLQRLEVTSPNGTLSLIQGTEKAVEMIHEVKTGGRKVMLIGNGGSAAIASHMQNDLCDSAGIRAIVFNEASFLTAISNDHGYEGFFEEAVKLWAAPNDLLLAVSSSGKSKNILRAVQQCNEIGGHVITFSGFLPNNPLRSLGDLNFYVPAQEYGLVESSHAALGHFLTDCAAMIKQLPA